MDMTMIETKGPRPYHIGRMSLPKDDGNLGRALGARLKAKGYKINLFPADWTEPRYPGDSIMRVDLVRGDEIGDVRVQWYGNGLKPTPDDKLKVGAFLPGYETSSPGDTPKWWPDKDKWVNNRAAASRTFTQYVIAAIRDGWRPRCT